MVVSEFPLVLPWEHELFRTKQTKHLDCILESAVLSLSQKENAVSIQ